METRKLLSLIVFFSAMAGISCSSGWFGENTGRATPVVESVESDATIRTALADIERMPDSPLGYVNLAMLYMKSSRQSGDFLLIRKAAAAVERALELDRDYFPARKLEASLHLANHRFSDAIDVAKKLTEEVPNDPFAFGVLTDAYIEVGEYDK